MLLVVGIMLPVLRNGSAIVEQAYITMPYKNSFLHQCSFLSVSKKRKNLASNPATDYATN